MRVTETGLSYEGVTGGSAEGGPQRDMAARYQGWEKRKELTFVRHVI